MDEELLEIEKLRLEMQSKLTAWRDELKADAHRARVRAYLGWQKKEVTKPLPSAEEWKRIEARAEEAKRVKVAKEEEKRLAAKRARWGIL